MSRGLGKVEREVLALLRRKRTSDPYDGEPPHNRRELLAEMYGDYDYDEGTDIEWTRSQRESVNRAIRSLIRKGWVIEGHDGKLMAFDEDHNFHVTMAEVKARIKANVAAKYGL